MTTDRRLFEWVELQQQLCANTYGQGDCTAIVGRVRDRKCFNTRVTCQDPENYDGTETLTLNFCYNQSGIPKDKIYLPWLVDAKAKGQKLNFGGGNKNAGAFGIRGAFSFTVEDHPYSDILTDPYLAERDYIATERGTFWTKWRVRNPYYLNSVVRYHTCYLDQNNEIIESSVETRTYFVSEFAGPTSDDVVRIGCNDILTYATNDNAVFPAASNGKLSADLDTSTTSITLIPAGVGDEYPASGFVAIGKKEVVTFTRTGDSMTIGRAEKNTTAQEHKTNDVVQLCHAFTSQRPRDILYTLCKAADIDDQWLDQTQWIAESSLALLDRLYTAFLAEPVGVTQLLQEITEQMYFTLYWDEYAAKLRIKAVRPPAGEQITLLDGNSNLLKDSVQWTDRANDLITQVWIDYAPRNPLLTDQNNYQVRDIAGLFDNENLYGFRAIKKIVSRWLESTDGGAATELANRLLERYGDIPKECSFELDAKDAASVGIGSFVAVQNRHTVDDVGMPVSLPLQITSVNEAIARHVYRYTAQTFIGFTVLNAGEYPIEIGGNENYNINLRELFDSKWGLTLESGDIVTFIVRSGATIGCVYPDGDLDADRNSADFIGKGYEVLPGSGGYFAFPLLYRRTITTPRVYEDGDTYLDPDDDTPQSGTVFSRYAFFNNEFATVRSPAFGIKEYPLKRAAIVRGSFPTGVTVKLVIETGASVVGQGGGVSVAVLHGNSDYLPRAGDGTDAIDATDGPLEITNNGIIGGGSGGPGASLSPNSLGDLTVTQTIYQSSGHAPSVTKNWQETESLLKDVSQSGQINNFLKPLGENGFNTPYNAGGTPDLPSGGLAGRAIVGVSNVTFVSTGDIRGDMV